VILLDTCTLLWLASDHRQLTARAKDLLSRHAGALFISAITAFEIALKHARGRLELPLPPEEWIEEALAFHGIDEVPVDWRIAARSALLAPYHADPCDRIIVATALCRGWAILTPDPLISEYREAQVVW
jgi:PIN domain nuclease of toxin-antitoxin system